MRKSKQELIASVEAMFGKVENRGKTAQGRFSAAEFNDMVELLTQLAETCSTRSELADALNSLSYYSRQQIDQMMTGKADASNVYSKSEIEGLLNNLPYYTRPQINQMMTGKADASNVYSKSEIDLLLNQLNGEYYAR